MPSSPSESLAAALVGPTTPAVAVHLDQRQSTNSNGVAAQALEHILPSTLDPAACHIVTTVTAYNKTLYDDPQGEPGAVVALHPPPSTPGLRAFYFGIILNKTNPFARGQSVFFCPSWWRQVPPCCRSKHTNAGTTTVRVCPSCGGDIR